MTRTTGWLGPFTASGAVVAALGLASYVAGWRLGWIELMVVAAGCLVALLIALALVVGRLGLRIERSIDPERVMVGEPAGALLTATNPTRRPTRSIVVEDHIGSSVLPVTIPTLAPDSSHRSFYSLPTDRRAKLEIGPAEVTRTDPLTLLRRRVGHAPSTTLWVHPRWTLVEALPNGFAKDLEGPTSDASPAGDIAFHALRPYQLGDDRRHIHWMSTARTGTLMVRHYVDNRRPSLAVLLDDGAIAYDLDQFETAIEITTSLLLSSLALQLPIVARTSTAWIQGRLRPRTRDALVEDLTVITPNPNEASLVHAAAELTRVESQTSAVAIITGNRRPDELLPTVSLIRRRARVIVIVVAPAAESTHVPIRTLPGATVLTVGDLDEFRTVWNGIRS